ncbi:MAG: lipoyl synthase [Clostridiales bacterium]|nr:lipoyl synthase [Clostridiales bacterium]
MKNDYVKKPDWLKVNAFPGENYMNVKNILDSCNVNTVCDEALCPNRGKCFNENTATFIILGKVCSRHCAFCNVTSGLPQCVDDEEINGIAQAVKKLGLQYVVITSVTRDDLEDGGSAHFAKCINSIKQMNPTTHIEGLIPDFNGNIKAVHRVLDTPYTVMDHNIETIPSLYQKIRPEANYQQSLDVIAEFKKYKPHNISKSGIMLGLGETRKEVKQVMKDLRAIDCDILTIGQYLRPSKQHTPVHEYIHPGVFDEYKEIGLDLGFKYVESSPLTRSSYLAHRAYTHIIDNK